MGEEHQRDAALPDCPSDDWPEWWGENLEIRETLGIDNLGPYEPPQFADGIYAYKVVLEIEAKYDCSIRILSLNPDQDGVWEIRADGRTVALTERRRNENGNSIYEIDSETFIEAVKNAVVE